VSREAFVWPEVVVELATRCRFPTGPIDCAVSGGADSLALVALAVCSGHDVTAWHVRHGLRPAAETADEPERIAAMLAPLGVPLRVVDVSTAINVDLGNIEEQAREARYAALPAGVAVAHTADDVAETVIANLIRGSGLDGLSPMRPSAGFGHRIRPLLDLRRVDTERVCDALGWAPLIDSMNSDRRYLRVRIRREVLPLLDDVAGRDVRALLARFAAVTAADVAVLEALAAELDPTDSRALREAPLSLARRAVRQWLTSEAGDEHGHPPDLATVDRVVAVARLEALGTEVGRGLRVVRRLGGRLEIVRPEGA
jgi:tRNA(Ile)-lysidine synthase